MNATGDHPDDIVRRVQSEMSSWAPQEGPNWSDLMGRVGRGPARMLRIYAVASLTLVAILMVAFLVMSALHITGSLAGEPAVSRVQLDR